MRQQALLSDFGRLTMHPERRTNPDMETVETFKGAGKSNGTPWPPWEAVTCSQKWDSQKTGLDPFTLP